MLTAYHAKYYAHDLTKVGASSHADRLSTSLFDASVDLNPHQVEAAIFAIRSPLSKGVILADEVGLGKTIEAGIVLCQFWAEHKRRLLVICPASLRRQWSLELEEKFNLPSAILESDIFKSTSSGDSPLVQEKIVIVSYQFASRFKDELHKVGWHLAVIDEAHKLRNLYKPDNKMGRNIQYALSEHRKVLLTATPLQNSLMELYGLASLIDDRLFGSPESFKAAYVNGTPNVEELKTRLKPFLQRTLRRQVLEYIRYTKREAFTQPFTPTKEEQKLYDAVSDFLLLHDTYAIPWAQRKLVVLIIRKLMASSSYALIGTLKTIKQRLEDMKVSGKEKPLNLRSGLVAMHDLDTEYLEEEPEPQPMKPPSSKGKPIDLEKLQYEIDQIESFTALARSIKVESKAKELLKALRIGFARMQELGGERKALIFTESSRTQRYLKDFLGENGYKSKIVTFNGQNDDDELARDIYKAWREKNSKTGRVTGAATVDMRMALVDFFRDEGEIMIATEAAAEGLNLQFCSLLVNYDLPWNPQRVEQRIGRVHRYGQKHDVVVVNFLNETNWADQRIYELLKEKFQLFDGVFGASDEVLGRMESGIDFEKRILDIYEACRSPEEIENAFQQLQEELDAPIQERLSQTRKTLFDHFDEDVHQRLRLRLESAESRLDDVTRMFWELTKFVYTEKYGTHRSPYYFNDEKLIFGSDQEFINAGARLFDENERVPMYYYLDTSPPEKVDPLALAVRRKRKVEDLKNPVTGYAFRLSSLEGESVVKWAKELESQPAHVDFYLSKNPHRIALLEEHIGKSGWLLLSQLTMETFEKTDQLLFAVCDSEGSLLMPEIGEKLLLLHAEATEAGYLPCPHQELLEAVLRSRTGELLKQAEVSNHSYFNEELDKLDLWAEDLKNGLELEIKRLDKEIRELDRQSKQIIGLQEKLQFQKQKAALDSRRTNKRRELFTSQDEIDKKRDTLIKQIEAQLQKSTFELKELFKISWELH